jgi:alkanesulfonate monooxygenase SsuD/methylene tetrahydromethanopterin reductase-like flavin-dependent oxidoreductase (luciferase family)
MSPFTDARMHLGIELGGAGRHPGAARWTGQDPLAAAGVRNHLALVLAAARRGLDFVALPDPQVEGAPDALTLATRIAPLAGGVGLVPAAPVTGVDPAALAAAVSALDAASSGRDGWQPYVPADAVQPGTAAERWRGAGETIEQVARLRPAGPGARRPLVVLRADDPAALPVVGRWADVVRITATGLDAADDARDRVRAAVADAGRDPDEVAVMVDVEVHLGADRNRAQADLVRLDAIEAAEPSSLRVVGTAADVADLVGAVVRLGAADGITLVPLALPTDLRRIADDLVPLLAGRGLLRTGWSGLRRPVRVPIPTGGGVAGKAVAGKVSA